MPPNKEELFKIIGMTESRRIEFEELHPRRCKALQLPWPSLPRGSMLSVSVLDAPASGFCAPSTPFAAILVPLGREDDWIFCAPNGLWDLLFSASVFRLVILIRTNPKGDIDDNGCGNADDCYGDVLINNSNIHGHSHVDNDGDGTNSNVHVDDVDGHTNDKNDCGVSFKQEILPLLHCLFPWKRFPDGPPSDPFVTYEDGVRDRSVVEIKYSPVLGKILVEDIELDDETILSSNVRVQLNHTLLRRRMRFRNMPNLIQTEVPIIFYKDGNPAPNCTLKDVKVERNNPHSIQRALEVRPDHSEIVHKYLPSIIAGLILASPSVEACILSRNRVRVLSIGLGGGALPIFLRRKFGFHVLAVDIDEIVVNLARRHFGLEEDDHLQVKIQDGVDVVVGIAKQVIGSGTLTVEDLNKWRQLNVDPGGCICVGNSREDDEVDARVHVIVVDVDAGNARLGLLSPPSSFLTRIFLLSARIALHVGGVLVMNVIPRDDHNLKIVTDALHEFFDGIYQIRHDANHVLFALASKVGDLDLGCSFATKIMQVVDTDLLDRIEEID